MATLLIAEHEHEVLKDSTNKALTAATQLGAEVHVLVAGGGQGTKAAAEAEAKAKALVRTMLPVGVRSVGPDVAHPALIGDMKLVGPDVTHPNFIYWDKDSSSFPR